MVLITVSWYGWLLEVRYGWLNSTVRPIWYVSPEWVHDTYIPSYFSSWKQYLNWLFRTYLRTPGDNFPNQGGSMMVLGYCQGKLWNEGNMQSDFLRFYVICSILLLVFVLIVLNASTVSLAIILLFESFFSQGIWQSSWQPSSLPFFFCRVKLSKSTVMYATFSVFCSRYDARLSNYLSTTRKSLMSS